MADREAAERAVGAAKLAEAERVLLELESTASDRLSALERETQRPSCRAWPTRWRPRASRPRRVRRARCAAPTRNSRRSRRRRGCARRSKRPTTSAQRFAPSQASRRRSSRRSLPSSAMQRRRGASRVSRARCLRRPRHPSRSARSHRASRSRRRTSGSAHSTRSRRCASTAASATCGCSRSCALCALDEPDDLTADLLAQIKSSQEREDPVWSDDDGAHGLLASAAVRHRPRARRTWARRAPRGVRARAALRRAPARGRGSTRGADCGRARLLPALCLRFGRCCVVVATAARRERDR